MLGPEGEDGRRPGEVVRTAFTLIPDLRVMATACHVSIVSTFRAVPPWLWAIQVFALAVFQMSFFVLLVGVGESPGIDVEYVALGNALFSVVYASVYSICSVPGVEKHAGTLPLIMATPTRLFTVFIGLSLFQILCSLLTVIVSLSVASSLSWIDLGGVDASSFACVVLVTSFSMAGFGLMLSSIGLFLRSASVLASLAVYVTLVLCGANFPISLLPNYLQALSNAIPITYGLQALREVAVGGGLEQIYPSIGAMLLIGAALYGLAYLAFKRFERMARITGSMDLF